MLRSVLLGLILLQIPSVGCAQTKGNQASPPTDSAPLVLAEWNAYAYRPSFEKPMSVAGDPEGNIYLLDWVRGSVLRFSTDGTVVASWKVPDPDPSNHPSIALNAIAVSDEGLYVSDQSASCVHRFTQEGKPRGTLPFEATQNGLAVDPLGNVYVSGFRAGDQERIRKPALWKLNRLGDVLNRWDRHTGPLTVDQKGTLYAVTEAYEDGPLSILRLDPAGGRISEWEVANLPPLAFIQGIAVDSRGHVFLTARLKSDPTDDDPKVRFDKRAIVELDEKGNWTRDWTSAGPDYRPIVEPIGVAVDNSGDLYVTDFAVSRVVKYDPRKTP